jgi:hypothetical protein
VVPPGGKGTIKVMGLAGHGSAAWAAGAHTPDKASATSRVEKRRREGRGR